MLEAVQRRLAQQVVRFTGGGRPALFWALRLTVAATSSYVVASMLFPGTRPLLAPLTALLVVQVTPVSLLASGLDRVVSVVAGVSLAVGFATVVPLEWWSLGVLIAISIMIGQALRLRSNLIEVAISAMLVLGVGSAGSGSAAWQRIAETLVGAAVGIAANLLFPPKVASADAGSAIAELAKSMGRLLTRAAEELADSELRDKDVASRARDWLDEARLITYDVPRVGEALLRAEQSRKFNVRAVGTPDRGPGLRQGLEAVEHSAVAIRSLFRAVADAVNDEEWPDDEVGAAVLQGLVHVFRELADGIVAFGELVRAESGPTASGAIPEIHRVEAALEGLHEARARLNDAMFLDTHPVISELHATVLSTVKRLLSETNFEARVRRQIRLRPPSRRRLRRPADRATRDQEQDNPTIQMRRPSDPQ